eukprot:1125316_1
MAEQKSTSSDRIPDDELAKIHAIVMQRFMKGSSNPMQAEPLCKETDLQRSKRTKNYLDSGAVALCTKCEKFLLFCSCANLEHGEHVNFGWPECYTKEQKKENLHRWANHFEAELPKTASGVPIFDVKLMAKDFLNKNIVDVIKTKERSQVNDGEFRPKK